MVKASSSATTSAGGDHRWERHVGGAAAPRRCVGWVGSGGLAVAMEIGAWRSCAKEKERLKYHQVTAAAPLSIDLSPGPSRRRDSAEEGREGGNHLWQAKKAG